MKTNMGTIDRIIRICLAAVVALLFLQDMISGIAAVILGIFAAVLAVTSLIGFCPLYVPLGMNTARKK